MAVLKSGRSGIRNLTAVFLLLAVSASADSTPALTYRDLKQVIQMESIGSFDGLLKYFQSAPRFEELLKNPVLNERSKALHLKLVSPTFPRIVMHGGNLTMMILGDPRLDEAQFLEIIEFVPETRSYAFRLINFHAKGTDEEFVDDANAADFTKFKDPIFQSAANCFICHQMEANESRPRWMTGPIWQTPFGEVDDVLHFGSKDFENWKLFQKTYADPVLGARYRALKLSKIKELDDGSLVFADQPNQKLSDFMDGQNAYRIARIIEGSKNFTKYEPAIVSSFFSCGEMSQFLRPTEAAAREASVKNSIIQTENDRRIYVRARVKKDDLTPEAVQLLLKDDWRTLKDDPSVIEADDSDFIRYSDLPLEEILEKTVRLTSDVSLLTAISEDTLVKMDPIDLTGFIQNGIDFSSLPEPEVPELIQTKNQDYYSSVAKLRYLLEDSVSEAPLYWSISKSSPFGDSYDFADDQGGLERVLSDGLSGRVFADYPQFKPLFMHHHLSRKNLKIPESDFCQVLKSVQNEALFPQR